MSPSKQALGFLSDTLRIYSPTMNEHDLASFLLRSMKRDFGYDNVRLDEAGNTIGEVGSGKTRVLLCGHMDTVPGKIAVRLEDGKMYGRGAVDAKSALCAMVVAGSRLRDKVRARLTVACVTREEGDGLGIQTLMKEGIRYEYAIFGEPGGAEKVTIGYRGRIAAHLVIRTEGGHAASPWAHKSAIDASLNLVKKLQSYAKENSKKGDHYRSLSVSLTLFRGGSYQNVLPNIAKLTLDTRVPLGMSCDQVEKDFRSIVQKFTTKNEFARIAVSFDEPTEPYESAPDSLLVRAFQRAIIVGTGERPIILRKTATGDMNTFASHTDTACVTYGPGNSKLSHTDHEYVLVDDYRRSIDVLCEAVRQIEVLSATRNAAAKKGRTGFE